MASTRYVDFSATNNGDGTTPAQAGSPGGVGAYNTLVSITVTTGDTLWIRRAGTLTLAGVLSVTTANVSYIGWPISTDADYGTRPAAGTSQGWDNDSTSVLPIIANTGANNFDVTTNTGQTFKRIKFNWTGSTNGTLPTVACTFFYCQWLQSGGTVAVNPSHSTGTVSLNQCTITVSSASTDGFLFNSAGFVQLIDCTITRSNSGTGKAALNIGASAGGGEFVRCSFVFSDRLNIPLRCINYSGNITTANPPLVFIDCIVDNSVNSGAAGGEAAVAILGRAIIRNMSVKGSNVVISIPASIPVPTMHFSTIQQTYPMANGALDISGSGTGQVPVIVGNFLPIYGNTSNDLSTNANGGNLFIAQSAIFLHSSRTGTAQLTTEPQSGIYLASRNGLLGHHGISTRLNRSFTNQVARTGGTSYSYRLQTDQGVTVPLLLGISGFGDMIFANLTNNSQTITIYGAYKGFSIAPSADDIWIEVQSKSGDGTQWATTSSKVGSAVLPTALTSDSSSWTGESGLTSFKIAVSITQTASNPNWNPIRIRYCKPQISYSGFGESYDNNGIIYIDPVPVVT